jgi:hypothetical protein
MEHKQNSNEVKSSNKLKHLTCKEKTGKVVIWYGIHLHVFFELEGTSTNPNSVQKTP